MEPVNPPSNIYPQPVDATQLGAMSSPPMPPQPPSIEPSAPMASSHGPSQPPVPAYTPMSDPKYTTALPTQAAPNNQAFVSAQPVFVQPMMAQPVVWGRKPQHLQCPTCQNPVLTTTVSESGLAVWLSVCGCCIFCPCCFFVPLLVEDLKDISHSCPVCQAHLGDAKMLKT
ncbi:hypothetical protein BASA50_002023 [Batrachochytrium salamandrivorans]|uniref:LITAF domain-containing protein n=1 Tax=Batrachochytrium salamandrivorans TaxID=1357716 RepID=A0ABQ8FQB9_9FUNG|nr:hypothetical protein BASA62_003216 [Batrachochytrium salamandrivorans]KAH6600855.1 hypothetical protein BASA50_002023 [Batrachochytrium salamandrivorans]KAH9266635.1 hypothetical protein BASA83_010440 [Batrachochytrium salamandrivorans]